MNAITVIHPFKHKGDWVFTDESNGLVREPFVSGADEVIEEALKHKGLKNPEEGFRLVFSSEEFPGYDISLRWVRPEASGNVYHCVELDMEGWLCPALLKYFEKPPKKIYAQFKA